MKPGNNKILILLLGLVFLNALAWTGILQLSPGGLEIVFFSVGQGDSIFIQTPTRQQILIDGGPDNTVLRKLNEEMPFWDRSLDLVILTHPERDHISGLTEVLNRYRVDNVMWTGIEGATVRYEKWKKALSEENQIIARSGQEILLSEGNLKVLHPPRSLYEERYQRSNKTSIVTKLNFGRNDFLFTGDIPKRVERGLLFEDIEVKVFKVAHHGSKTSSSEEFLKKVEPELGIISVGSENNFGHPHSEVLSRLSKYDIKTLRTDQDGDIKIISDQEKYKILTR